MMNNAISADPAAKLVVTAANIRPVSEVDVASIALLAQTVWVNTYAKDGIDTVFCRYVSDAFSCDTLLHELRNNHLIVAERKQCLLGYVLLELRHSLANSERNTLAVIALDTRQDKFRNVPYISKLVKQSPL